MEKQKIYADLAIQTANASIVQINQSDASKTEMDNFMVSGATEEKNQNQKGY